MEVDNKDNTNDNKDDNLSILDRLIIFNGSFIVIVAVGWFLYKVSTLNPI